MTSIRGCSSLDRDDSKPTIYYIKDSKLAVIGEPRAPG